MISFAMAHLLGTDRAQLLLLPEAVDDYVGPDNPVCFIEAFVDGLDLAAASFVRVAAKETGRPGYDPADLLKLYVHGYSAPRRRGRSIALLPLLSRIVRSAPRSPVRATGRAARPPRGRLRGFSPSCERDCVTECRNPAGCRADRRRDLRRRATLTSPSYVPSNDACSGGYR